MPAKHGDSTTFETGLSFSSSSQSETGIEHSFSGRLRFSKSTQDTHDL